MKSIFLLLILIISLAGCTLLGEQTPAVPQSSVAPVIEVEQALQSTPTPVMPPELVGDLDVQQLMLFSHTRWQTLTAEYKVTVYPAGESTGEPSQQTVQIWIRLPLEFKSQISDSVNGLVATRISDGKSILDSEGNISETPAFLSEPFIPPNYPSDTVYMHPMAGYLGTPVSDLIFPAGLAQRGGEYRITGEEMLVGRNVQVVEWSRTPGSLIDRFWIDKLTGVVLRQQNYGKQQNISPLSDIQAVFVNFDGDIPADTFRLDQIPTPIPVEKPADSGSAVVTILSQVVNIRSGPNTGYKVIATVETGVVLPVVGKNPSGDWWKVDLNGQLGWVFGSLVEFSGEIEDVPVTNY